MDYSFSSSFAPRLKVTKVRWVSKSLKNPLTDDSMT